MVQPIQRRSQYRRLRIVYNYALRVSVLFMQVVVLCNISLTWYCGAYRASLRMWESPMFGCKKSISYLIDLPAITLSLNNASLAEVLSMKRDAATRFDGWLFSTRCARTIYVPNVGRPTSTSSGLNNRVYQLDTLYIAYEVMVPTPKDLLSVLKISVHRSRSPTMFYIKSQETLADGS